MPVTAAPAYGLVCYGCWVESKLVPTHRDLERASEWRALQLQAAKVETLAAAFEATLRLVLIACENVKRTEGIDERSRVELYTPLREILRLIDPALADRAFPDGLELVEDTSRVEAMLANLGADASTAEPTHAPEPTPRRAPREGHVARWGRAWVPTEGATRAPYERAPRAMPGASLELLAYQDGEVMIHVRSGDDRSYLATVEEHLVDELERFAAQAIVRRSAAAEDQAIEDANALADQIIGGDVTQLLGERPTMAQALAALASMNQDGPKVLILTREAANALAEEAHVPHLEHGDTFVGATVQIIDEELPPEAGDPDVAAEIADELASDAALDHLLDDMRNDDPTDPGLTARRGGEE